MSEPRDTIPAPPDLRIPWDEEPASLDAEAPVVTVLRPVTFFPSVLQPDDTDACFALDSDALADD